MCLVRFSHTIFLVVCSAFMASAQSGAGGDVAAAGSARAVRRLPATHGQVELGGIHGPLPYTVPGSGPWNAFLKGDVSFALLGIPFTAGFDLGTDLPLRGQRNKVRLSFDPQQLKEKDKWADAHALQRMQAKVDSLEKVRGELTRKLKGAETRLAALEELPPMPQMPDLREMGLDTALALPDTSLALPDTTGLHPPAVNGLADSLSVSARPLDAPMLDRGQADSLRTVIARHQERLLLVERALAEQQQQVQRLTAVMNATKAEESLLTKLGRGVKRLDIGTCSPGSSEFLINGINFQGISFEYAHKDLFLAVDHGRSFDDRWMDADPVSRNVRRLQQSLLLIDARDLAPRRLTAVRTGFGRTDDTHAHVGYLYGTRADMPPGMALPAGEGAMLRNHVAEVDLGYAVRKGHVLRMVYARSLVLAGTGAAEGTERQTAADLFGATNKDQALKLGWSSRFDRTGTRVDLEARSVSAFFQSFGMGFIRNGSRLAEARLDQAIGERLRLRGRYAIEERTLPGEGAQQMDLRRAQVQVMYRPDKAWTLRGSYMPLVSRWNTANGPMVSANDCYAGGADLRKRWRAMTVTMSADVGLYQWRMNTGAAQWMENHTVSVALQGNERWSARVAWTAMRGQADTLTSTMDNLTVQGGYRTRNKASFDAAVQCPVNERTGWMMAVGWPLGARTMLGFKGESYSRSDLFFAGDHAYDRYSMYTWTASIKRQW